MGSFIGGLADGYNGFQQGAAREEARQLALQRATLANKREAQEQQLFDMKVAEANRLQAERASLAAVSNKATFAEGSDGAPAAVTLGDSRISYGNMPAGVSGADVAGSDARQFRRNEGATSGIEPALASVSPEVAATPFKVNGKDYGDRASAVKAQAAYDAPDAVMGRQAGVLRNSGYPEKAMTLETSVRDNKTSALKHSTAELDFAKKLRSEGVIEAEKFLNSGDAVNAKAALNAGGEYKVVGDMRATPVTKMVNGKEWQTYDWEFDAALPDGTVVPRKINSYELSLSLMPLKERLEADRKATDSETTRTYREESNRNAAERIRLEYELGEKKIDAANARGRGNGDMPPDERKAYTSAMNDSRQKAEAAQKALSELLKQRKYANAEPGSPQAAEVQGLRDKIAKHDADGDTFSQALISSLGSGAGGRTTAPGAAPAGAKEKPSLSQNKTSALATPKNQAEYDALPKGARYMRDGQAFEKK